MLRYKTVHVIIAVLLLLNLAVPVVVASPDQSAATPVDNTTTSQNQTPQATSDNTTTVSTPAQPEAVIPGLDEALADAETAVRQTQADRIRQELDNLGNELERLNTEYFAESQKLAAIDASLEQAREQLRWFEAELEAQRQVLNERLANIYKHGDMEPVEAIINNASFSELFTRVSMLLKIGEQDAELLAKLQEQKLKIEETKNALNQLFEEQKVITSELESRKAAIEQKMQQETELLAGLDSETKVIFEQEEERRRKEQAEVVKRLTTKPKPAETKISLQPGSIAFEALKYLGVPYVWGGENPNIGLDCSGLVKIVFKKFGVELFHYSGTQAQSGVPVGYDELQPGDLVFFGSPIHHVGIYLGEGYYIHAPKRNDVVKISKLADRNDHAGARRIITALNVNQ